ncbi:MAG: GatB/YqeY domain-containing protein [Solirubrobacterales bacterium]
MIAETVKADAQAALKEGDRRKAAALRMIQDVLQQEVKLGKGDELAALQREQKKRLEAAEAYEEAGRDEQAADERYEAELIGGYLPAQLDDAELAEMVDQAVIETGAEGPSDMGKVMGLLKERAAGRADGQRLSTAVRERLGA